MKPTVLRDGILVNAMNASTVNKFPKEEALGTLGPLSAF
jgi:hypothetical protein